MEFPVVSVIVPAHQADYGLEECLVSLKNQDYPGVMEIIVANDGNHSEVHRLCVRFGVLECVVVPGGSSFRARNAALELATGGLIAFTDSNKFASRDWVRVGVELLDATRVDYLAGSVKIVPDQDRGRDSAYWLEVHRAFPVETYLKLRHFGVTGNLMVRRAVFETCGVFDGTLISGGDFVWGQRVFSYGLTQDYSNRFTVFMEARSMSQILLKALRVLSGKLEAGARGGQPVEKNASLWIIARLLVPVFRLSANAVPEKAKRLSAYGRAYLLNWLIRVATAGYLFYVRLTGRLPGIVYYRR